MPVPTLPIDLLLYALCPLFRLHGKDSDGTGANQGYRLLQLCRLTPQQKERATETMRHHAFEFKREVREIAIETDQHATNGFATNMLGHSVRHCMWLMTPGTPRPPPLILDTGIHRRMGRDWNIAVLVAAILRHARPPVSILIVTSGTRSSQTFAELIHSRVDTNDVLQAHNSKIVMRTLNRVSIKSWSSIKHLIAVDLVIVNDAQFMSFNAVLPLPVNTAGIFVCQGPSCTSQLEKALPGATLASTNTPN